VDFQLWKYENAGVIPSAAVALRRKSKEPETAKIALPPALHSLSPFPLPPERRVFPDCVLLRLTYGAMPEHFHRLIHTSALELTLVAHTWRCLPCVRPSSNMVPARPVSATFTA
jgi:hypothetical protein